MAETNTELGRAVAAVLESMGASPETAGAALGINARTLDAMCLGIVPMRSLVIRFAQGVGKNCGGAAAAPDWWGDVDAWLALAGYTPRRDLPPEAPGHSSPRPGDEPAGPEDMPARDFYRPTYERQTVGATCVHIFRVLDRQERPAFEITMRADVDYKARATQLKADLQSLGKDHFDRKYGRHRVPHPGDDRP